MASLARSKDKGAPRRSADEVASHKAESWGAGLPASGNFKRKRTEASIPPFKRRERKHKPAGLGAGEEKSHRARHRPSGGAAATKANGSAAAAATKDAEEVTHANGGGILSVAENGEAFLGGLNGVMPFTPATAMELGTLPDSANVGGMNFLPPDIPDDALAGDEFGWLNESALQGLGPDDSFTVGGGLAVPMDDISAFDSW